VWFENRRVIEILRGIESHALQLREHKSVPVTTELDTLNPRLNLPMERPLYARTQKARIDSEHVENADEQADPTALFEQVYVDPGPLRAQIHRALRREPAVGLTTIVGEHPLAQGLAELVTYLSLKDDAFAVVFDAEHEESIGWEDEAGTRRVATLPRVTYARRTTA
jgi:hypothetical protein